MFWDFFSFSYCKYYFFGTYEQDVCDTYANKMRMIKINESTLTKHTALLQSGCVKAKEPAASQICSTTMKMTMKMAMMTAALTLMREHENTQREFRHTARHAAVSPAGDICWPGEPHEILFLVLQSEACSPKITLCSRLLLIRREELMNAVSPPVAASHKGSRTA